MKKTCPVCGASFVAETTRKTCSPECGKVWAHKQKTASRGRCQADPVWRAKAKAYKPEHTYLAPQPMLRACVVCGKQFEALTTAKSCSQGCRVARKSKVRSASYFRRKADPAWHAMKKAWNREYDRKRRSELTGKPPREPKPPRARQLKPEREAYRQHMRQQRLAYLARVKRD
jgi:predicted nucleic acid-binding Zn ribbon protein